jgi:hypothetical protein
MMSGVPATPLRQQAIDPDAWPSQEELRAEGDRLYDRFVKPLEAEHQGEFAVVARDGTVLLGGSLAELTEEAVTRLGKEHFAFRVGDKAVGRIR